MIDQSIKVDNKEEKNMDYCLTDMEVEQNSNSDCKNRFAGYIKAMVASQEKKENEKNA